VIEVELPSIPILMTHKKVTLLVTQKLRPLAIVQRFAEVLLEG
jgi:hypothetical protein